MSVKSVCTSPLTLKDANDCTVDRTLSLIGWVDVRRKAMAASLGSVKKETVELLAHRRKEVTFVAQLRSLIKVWVIQLDQENITLKVTSFSPQHVS